jgi:hypothetical protein
MLKAIRYILRGFFMGDPVKILEARESVGFDDAFGRHYTDAGLDPESVRVFLEYMATEMYLPMDKLRPTDRFDVELAQRTSEWDSGFGLVLDQMSGFAKEAGLTITGKIESIDDYIRCMCAIEAASGKPLR